MNTTGTIITIIHTIMSTMFIIDMYTMIDAIIAHIIGIGIIISMIVDTTIDATIGTDIVGGGSG